MMGKQSIFPAYKTYAANEPKPEKSVRSEKILIMRVLMMNLKLLPDMPQNNPHYGERLRVYNIF